MNETSTSFLTAEVEKSKQFVDEVKTQPERNPDRNLPLEQLTRKILRQNRRFDAKDLMTEQVRTNQNLTQRQRPYWKRNDMIVESNVANPGNGFGPLSNRKASISTVQGPKCVT